MTWNAVLDCQRLTGSDFSSITDTKTQIEAAAEWRRAGLHFTAFKTISLLAGMQLSSLINYIPFFDTILKSSDTV